MMWEVGDLEVCGSRDDHPLTQRAPGGLSTCTDATTCTCYYNTVRFAVCRMLFRPELHQHLAQNQKRQNGMRH